MLFAFPVDMSQAGEGKLEMVVTHNGQSIESMVRDAGNSQVEASFIPEYSGDYEVDLRYNDHTVKGTKQLLIQSIGFNLCISLLLGYGIG